MNNVDYEGTWNAVKNSFATLRKKGYFARMNYMCCSSCGWASIHDTKYNKVVFFNRQATKHFNNGSFIMMQWNGDGNEIVKVFKENGLTVQWDGTEQNCISVIKYVV